MQGRQATTRPGRKQHARRLACNCRPSGGDAANRVLPRLAGCCFEKCFLQLLPSSAMSTNYFRATVLLLLGATGKPGCRATLTGREELPRLDCAVLEINTTPRQTAETADMPERQCSASVVAATAAAANPSVRRVCRHRSGSWRENVSAIRSAWRYPQQRVPWCYLVPHRRCLPNFSATPSAPSSALQGARVTACVMAARSARHVFTSAQGTTAAASAALKSQAARAWTACAATRAPAPRGAKLIESSASKAQVICCCSR